MVDIIPDRAIISCIPVRYSLLELYALSVAVGNPEGGLHDSGPGAIPIGGDICSSSPPSIDKRGIDAAVPAVAPRNLPV